MEPTPSPDPHIDLALDAVKARSARQRRARQAWIATSAIGVVAILAVAAIAGATNRDRVLDSATTGTSTSTPSTSPFDPDRDITIATATTTSTPSTHGTDGTDVPVATTTAPPVQTTVTLVPTTATAPPTSLPGANPTTTAAPVDDQRLASAMQTWAANRPARYRMTVRRSCFCPESVTNPVTITVDGTTITSPSDVTGLTVDDLYAEASAIGPEGRIVTLDFDEAIGYPTHLNLDNIIQAIDDEMAYIVTDFAVL